MLCCKIVGIYIPKTPSLLKIEETCSYDATSTNYLIKRPAFYEGNSFTLLRDFLKCVKTLNLLRSLYNNFPLASNHRTHILNRPRNRKVVAESVSGQLLAFASLPLDILNNKQKVFEDRVFVYTRPDPLFVA